MLNIKQENKCIYHLGLRRSTGAHTRQRAKPNNLFKRFLFTIVLSYFIWQPNMTPQVRLRAHAAWSWDVFLALTRCEFLPRFCSKLPGAETLPFLLLFSQPFSQHLSWFCIWGRSRTGSLSKGMITACLLSPRSEYNRKYNELWHQLFPCSLSLLFIPSGKKKFQMFIHLFISQISIFTAIGKISIHFASLWLGHVLGRAQSQSWVQGDFAGLSGNNRKATPL